MNTEKYNRKLAAILIADVKGYSRLMGEDEESTIRTLTSYREDLSPLFLFVFEREWSAGVKDGTPH
jgi:adenylate cyclase